MIGGDPLRIGFIGDGSIAHSVRETLVAAKLDHIVTGVLTRSCGGGNFPVMTSLEALFDTAPDVIVECAGHDAVRDHAEAVLRAGKPLILASIGALADQPLQDRLTAAARDTNARLIVAPGAIAGIDALAAARLGGLTRVRYVGTKPPLAWKGTPAEQLVDLAAITEPHVFFRGSAREAAASYPKNSNVCATIAIAGLGFDDTEVELCAAPDTAKNVHRLMFEGADGHFDIEVIGEPSPTNPKTSALTAHSIARLLAGMIVPVIV